jgi:hypothetical protein
MASRYDVMGMWIRREIDEAEEQLGHAARLDGLANTIREKYNELAETGFHNENMRKSAKETRYRATNERMSAMARLASVRKLMHTAATDHILVEMGFDPANFEKLNEEAA